MELARIHASVPGATAERAARHFREARALCERLSILSGLAEALTNLGVLAQDITGDLDAAREFQEQAVHIEVGIGHRLGVARTLYNLAEVAEHKHEWGRARVLALAAESLFKAMGSPLAKHPETLLARLPAEFASTGKLEELEQRRFRECALRDLVEEALRA